MNTVPAIASSYCERINAGILGEPLNTLTNLAFMVAAYLAWRRYRTMPASNRPDWLILALIAVCFIIGIGSFAFHAYPTRVTLLMDVVPIQMFILGYLALVLRRFLGLAFLAAIAGTVFFLLFSFTLVRVVGAGTLGGSIGYLPALLALVVLGAVTLRRQGLEHRIAGMALLQTAGIFLVSLTFRTLDRPLCEVWPIGLHLVWHLLNAVVLWRLLVAAIAYGAHPGTGEPNR